MRLHAFVLLPALALTTVFFQSAAYSAPPPTTCLQQLTYALRNCYTTNKPPAEQHACEENAEASYLQCEKGTSPPPPPVKPTPHEILCYEAERIADLACLNQPEPERNACIARAQQNLRLCLNAP
jgi:hypothetical protein